jgi:hypothetical protein
MFQKLPNDPLISKMDPVLKMWLYEQWLGDHRDDAELAKNHAYLLGSFWNAEAVQQMLGDNVHESSDEDMEESMRMVRDTNLKLLQTEEAPKRKRKRKATLKD